MEMLTKKLAVLLIFLMLLGLPCVQAEETTKVLDCAAQEGSLEYLKYVPTFEEAYAAAMEKVPGNALIVDIDYRLQGLYGELHWNFTIIYQDVETLQLQQLNVSVYGYDIGVEVGTSTSPFEQPKNWEFSYIREMTREWENAYGARMFWTPEMKADFAARYGGIGARLWTTNLCPTCRKKAILHWKKREQRQTKRCLIPMAYILMICPCGKIADI